MREREKERERERERERKREIDGSDVIKIGDEFRLSHANNCCESTPSLAKQDRWSLGAPQASYERRRHRNCFQTGPVQAFPKK